MKKIEELYKVRNFKTTTESIVFMRKMMKAMKDVKITEELKEHSISDFLDFFDSDLIEYVVSNFVLKQNGEEINYEEEFISDFETLALVFGMAVEKLMKKTNGERKAGKYQAINSVRR